MEQIKIGRFIAELRKQQGLTQAQLGELLGVTNKTVSRWENGNYMPESVCISFFGGLPGVAAGLLKSSYMFTAKQAGFLLLPVLVGLAFALAVGVLAGYYPASQAAKMEPVAAINAD